MVGTLVYIAWYASLCTYLVYRVYTTLCTPGYTYHTYVPGVTAVLHGAADCAGQRGPGL